MQELMFPVVEPATGAILAELPRAGRTEAGAALDAVQAGAEAWQASHPHERAAALRGIAEELREPATAQPLAELVARETGKRLVEATGEVAFSAAYFDWFAELALGADDSVEHQLVPGRRHRYTPRPVGITAVVTPWNFPVSIPARKMAAALAAGCPLLFKPSETAPLSGLELARVVARHLPPDTIRSAVGDPVGIVDVWLTDARVRALTFTGSTHTGAVLAATAAPQMVRTVLELGGNAPFIILDDADVDHAAELMATAKYRNNGQSCIAANEFWLPRGSRDAVIEAFSALSDDLVLGDPLESRTTLGPLTLPNDPSRLDALLADAKKHGATVRRSTCAVPDRGQFFGPALVLEPEDGARVLNEEIFGPVALVRVYDDVEEPIARTRLSAHGLGGYVVGMDSTKAQEVGQRLDVGIVGVNNAAPNTPQVPFGGLKMSGIGYEGGRVGLAAFQTLQTITTEFGAA